MNKVKEVVGIAFLCDGKLLISQSLKSSKRSKYTFVGGGVEVGESLLEAAIRECHEEMGNDFDIVESDLELVLEFEEQAASNPELTIHMHVFLSHLPIYELPKIHSEILEYRFYSLKEDDALLSSSISQHFIPYAIKNKLMY